MENAPGYIIRADHAENLIFTELIGFWDEATFDQFVKELRIAVASLGARDSAGGHLTLADTRDWGVQSQEIADKFAAITQDPTLMSKRVAMVIPGAMARMQAGRVVPGDNRAIFSSMEEARDWLLTKRDR